MDYISLWLTSLQQQDIYVKMNINLVKRNSLWNTNTTTAMVNILYYNNPINVFIHAAHTMTSLQYRYMEHRTGYWVKFNDTSALEGHLVSEIVK